MICLAIWLYVLYYTQTFGHYNVRRGLLTMPSIIFPQIPMTILYGMSLWSGFDYAFLLASMYKGSMCHMVVALLCWIIDCFLYLFAEDDYCQLQLEHYNSDCDERNQYIHLQTALFAFAFLPMWYAAAGATKRYAKDCNRKGTASSAIERAPLREPQTLDSASTMV